MTFDPAWLFVSLFPTGIGFVLFVYGRKQERLPQLVGGIALMVYPYFTPGIISMTIVGGAICGAIWYAVKAGW